MTSKKSYLSILLCILMAVPFVTYNGFGFSAEAAEGAEETPEAVKQWLKENSDRLELLKSQTKQYEAEDGSGEEFKQRVNNAVDDALKGLKENAPKTDEEVQTNGQNIMDAELRKVTVALAGIKNDANRKAEERLEQVFEKAKNSANSQEAKDLIAGHLGKAKEDLGTVSTFKEKVAKLQKLEKETNVLVGEAEKQVAIEKIQAEVDKVFEENEKLEADSRYTEEQKTAITEYVHAETDKIGELDPTNLETLRTQLEEKSKTILEEVKKMPAGTAKEDEVNEPAPGEPVAVEDNEDEPKENELPKEEEPKEDEKPVNETPTTVKPVDEKPDVDTPIVDNKQATDEKPVESTTTITESPSDMSTTTAKDDKSSTDKKTVLNNKSTNNKGAAKATKALPKTGETDTYTLAILVLALMSATVVLRKKASENK